MKIILKSILTKKPFLIIAVDDVEADLDEDLQATLDKYTGLES